MTGAAGGIALMWQLAPHPISRLIYTLLFMAFVLVTAMLAVSRFSSNRLFSQVVTTLGIFLLVIGTAFAWAVGINWHLTRNVKQVLDYERTRFTGGAPGGADRDDENALFIRTQISF